VEHVARDERGLEERKALDVVPVHVAEEHVGRQRHLVQELLAEQAQPCAAVEDEDRFAQAQLDAARVAADLHRAWSGRRNAAANAPKGDLHLSS
jgi:hypothetical protein